ncbi:neuraminidase-like domain-containing protein [Pendulispora albinea]|uniref:Tc toxin subunit A n=1 Tax=Pendulispora albinea TaxID=2741071 RepID=A0ABZ2M512_9BACT
MNATDAPVTSEDPCFRVTAVVVKTGTSQGIPDLDVEIWEAGADWTTPRGLAVTNYAGAISVIIDRDDLKKGAIFYFRIYQDGVLLRDTKDVIHWKEDVGECGVTIPVTPLPVIYRGGCCARYVVRGKVVGGTSDDALRGIAGLNVELWEDGATWAAPRAVAVTDDKGDFRAELSEADLVTSAKSVHFVVYSSDRTKKLADTSGSVTWTPSQLDNPVQIRVLTGEVRTQVTGFVRTRDAVPQSKVIVKAFALQMRAETLVGTSAATGDNGYYTLIAEYGDKKLDLLLRAYDDTNQEIAHSELITDAGPVVHVDLVVGNVSHVGPSEFVRIAGPVDEARGAIARKDLTPQDVGAVAAKYRLDPALVRLFVEAARAASLGGPPLLPELFYALGRHERTVSLSSALALPRTDNNAALKAALDDNVLPSSFAALATAQLDALDALRVGASLTDKTSNQSTRLSVILAIAGLTADERTVLLDTYLGHLGTPDHFWQFAAQLPPIKSKPELVAKLPAARLALHLGVLTLNHPPLVQALLSSGVTAPSALAKLSISDWLDHIQSTVTLPGSTSTRVGAPLEIVGNNPESTYAETLHSLATQAYPAPAIAAGLTANPIPNTAPLTKFFDANAAFDFTTTSVHAYARANPNAFKDNPNGRAQVERMARLVGVASSDATYSSVQTLWNKGFHSAGSVYRYGKEPFIEEVASTLGETAAAKIYDNAAQRHILALTLASQYGAAFQFPGVDGAIPVLGGSTPPESIPDWNALFGSLDYCACEQCQSIFGPSAYLTDILSFLTKRPISGSPKALDVLKQRLPDITKIRLSCANTNTVLPQIDLVNELLELRVAPPAPGSVPAYQTTWSAGDLAVHPEHLRSEAYDQLLQAVYPWALPYHHWVDESRAYLGILNVSRAELRSALVEDPITDLSVALEILGLTTYQRAIITATGASIESLQLGDYWGQTGQPSEWIPKLVPVPAFLAASGLSFDELPALLATSYVSAGQAVNIAFPSGSCDVNKATLAGITASSASFFDRIHRFERLRRALGWSPHRLDRAIATMGSGSIDDALLQQLSYAQRIVARSKADLDAVLTWRAGAIIDTHPDSVTKLSPFETMFQSRTTSAKAAENVFKLSADRKTLADESKNLTGYYTDLAAGLSSDVASLTAIANHEGLTNQLTLANISTLYRYVTLARALKISVSTLLVLLKLTGRTPFAASTPDHALRLWDDLDRAKAYRFSPEELNYILNDRDTTPATHRPNDDAIALVLGGLRDVLIKIAKTPPAPEDPDGTLTKQYLAAVFAASPASHAERAFAIVAGTATETIPEQNAFIDANFGPFMDAADAKAKLTGDGKLTIAANRFAYVLPFAQVFAGKQAAVTERLASALGSTNSIMRALLWQYAHARTSAGAPTAATSLSLFVALDAVAGPLSPSSAGAHFATYRLLQKITAVTTRLKVTVDDLPWLMTHAPLSLDALPLEPPTGASGRFDPWRRLIDAADLRNDFAGRRLFDLFERAATGADGWSRAKFLAEVVARTGLDSSDLTYFADVYQLTYPANFTDERALRRLKRSLAITQRLGISASIVWPWRDVLGGPSDTATDGPTASRAQANAIKQAVRGTFAPEAWPDAAKPVRNGLRERQRDALVSYVVHHDPSGPTDANALSDHLLTDVLMSGCAQTSRIKHALGSVQMFVQRILLNLEALATPSLVFSTDDASQWGWMKNYRVWEANRRIFIHPENWIEPQLRDDKTPLFKALEADLAKQDLTSEAAEDAVLAYLQGLDEIAHLEVIAMTGDYESTNTLTYHVVARTKSIPRTYYYRTWVGRRYWTAWEKIDLDIQSDHVQLAISNRRPYLIWAVVTQASAQNSSSTRPAGSGSIGAIVGAAVGATSGEPAKPRLDVRLRWSTRHRGTWTKVQQSNGALPAQFNDPGVLDRPEFEVDPYNRNVRASAEERLQLASERLALRTSIDKKTDELIVDVVASDVFVFTGYEVISSGWDPWPEPNAPRVPRFEPKTYTWGQHFRLAGSRGIAYPEFYSAVPIEENRTPISRTQAYYQWLRTKYRGLALPIPYRGRIFSSYDDGPSRIDAWVLDTTPTSMDVVRAPGLRLRSPAGDPRNIDLSFSWTTEPMFVQDRERCFFVTSDPVNPPKPPPPPSLKSLGIASVPRAAPFPPSALATAPPPVDSTSSTGRLWSAVAGRDVDLSAPGSQQRPYNASLYTSATATASSRADALFTFTPFYHPFVRDMLLQVGRDGIEGLLDPKAGTAGASLRRQQLRDTSIFNNTYHPSWYVRTPLPVEEFDFEYQGTYSQYNWELFFHIPLLIANKLTTEQRFEEARKWFHYIFNPTEPKEYPWGEELAPQRFWKLKPFYELASGEHDERGPIQQLLQLLSYKGDDPARVAARQRLDDQIFDWRRHPFSPHRIARLRQVAYQKTVVMKYLDMLIAWGDQLFARNTIESIQEATELYLVALRILGRRPQRLPAQSVTDKTYDDVASMLDDFSNLEVALPPSPAGSTPSDLGGEILLHGPSLYFCVPPNDKLLRYWDTVEDRLFKIRHCLDIEGIAQSLPLFEPPIDPGLLVKAAAAGIDIGSVLSDVSAPLPLRRYTVVAAHASDFVAEVKALGAALLSALEKRDAEELASLRAGQEIQLLSAIRVTKQLAVEDAKRALEGLEKSRDGARIRFEYYGSRSFINEWETAHIIGVGVAGGLRLAAGVMRLLSGGAAAVPDFTAGGAGGFSSPVALTSLGGTKSASVLANLASALETGAIAVDSVANISGTLGSYHRRKDDWEHQKNLAQKEIEQFDKQIAGAQIRIAMAEQELSVHDVQVQNSIDTRDFMRDKYTNQELYDWMIGQISAVYFQSYKLAYEMCKRAERAWAFELADTTSSFITFGYWDSLRKGLLAGEKLGLDLKRMQAAYLDKDKREYELQRDIALTMLDPYALQMLRETGSCLVNIPEALFDVDSPGHYLRRIKHVALTIAGTSGPYVPVRCTLTLLSSQVRTRPSLESGALVTSNLAVQSVVTSTAREDGGLFENNLHDERYLPFEGAGAVSHFRLELPNTVPLFDYRTISEVVLHMKYTAREGGMAFRTQVNAGLKEALNKTPADSSSRHGPLIGFSVKSAFSDPWTRFVSGSGSTPALTLALDPDHLPFQAGADAEITGLDFVLLVDDVTGWTKLTLKVTPKDAPTSDVELKSTGTVLQGQPTGSVTYSSPVPLGPWTITCAPADIPRLALATDLFVIVNYAHPTSGSLR